jgi:transcriptional regulator with XRE-family HTH domain
MLLACAVTVPQICAISFAVTCFSSFFAPARAITLPLLVAPDLLLAANARMQQSMQVVRVAGPAAASALVAAFGERAGHEIALGLGVAPSTLSRVCNGKSAPGHELLAAIRYTFGDEAFNEIATVEEPAAEETGA